KGNENQLQNATLQNTEPACDLLKVAMDVHAGFVVVAWQMDGSNAKAPQKFGIKDFLSWIEKRVKSCKEVSSCYEAGPTGFWLHRRLIGLGVKNLVVCPTCLDSR